MKGIKEFHAKFYSKREKIHQDSFIVNFCSIYKIKRRRPKNAKYEPKEWQAKCFVKNSDGLLVPVCQKSFLGILRITKRRLHTVVQNFHKTSLPPKENRGGNRKAKAFETKKESVQNFINKFQVSEAHYCRTAGSQRRYLDSSLSITKMWKMYSDSNTQPPVKASYFRRIFNTCYNLGFGTPRTDVWSTCLQLAEKIKASKDNAEKVTFMREIRVHKMRAQAYYELLRESPPETLTFSFDCEKNLALPRLPDQQAYYSRQVYLYNFAVVQGTSRGKINPSTVKCFCWTENEFKKGSNEIASCIYHILVTTNCEGISKIRLMCDECGGQNKNTTLVGMCAKWLSSQEVVSTLEIIFPVRGHSFIPPDRVFGQIKTQIRKTEVIKTPEQYLNIIEKHGSVVLLGEENVKIYDWKKSVQNVVKPPAGWHFAFAQSKRIIITKVNGSRIFVRGEFTYKSDLGSEQSICKRGKNISLISPEIIEKQNTLNEKKKVNVNNLLKCHYGENWRSDPTLSFYQNVLDNSMSEENVEEPICEENVEEPN